MTGRSSARAANGRDLVGWLATLGVTAAGAYLITKLVLWL